MAAQAEAAAAAVAQGLRLHEDVRRSTQLPLFYGFDKENTVSAHTLIDRVEAAAAVANWDDPRKCRELQLILRREAALWWESLRHFDIDRNANWNQVKERFLKSYAPKFTARTNCLNLLKLSQGPNEKVQTYFLRLDETFRRINENRPAAALAVRVAALAEHQDDARDARIKLEGLKDQEKFFLAQMFIAGLRENLRQKVMDEMRDDLMELVDLATEKETILTNENKPEQLPIFSIEEKNESENEKGNQKGEEIIENDLNSDEIDMINAIRRNRNLPPFKKTNFTGSCRYCKITGHSQKFCRKRIRDRAPQVDQNGTPYANQGPNPGQPRVTSIYQPENNYDVDFSKISALGMNHLNY